MATTLSPALTSKKDAGGALISAIDVGSNAMRLHIAGADARGNLKTIYYHREPVRLGHDAFTTGKLSPETMEKAQQAFETFRSMIDRHPVQTIRATGTSALRNSANASKLICRIEEKTGIRIEIISGEEEARLIHLSVHHRVPDMNKKRMLLIDIGGGSVEITLTEHGDIIALESFRMGTVRLLEMFRNTPNEAERIHLMDEYIDAMRQKVREEITGKKVDLCIGTGGNVEALGELGVSLLDNNSSQHLRFKEIKKLVKKLQSMSYEDRINRLGLRPDRADVIIPASLVLKSIVKMARPADLIIPPSVGLADGLLLDLLDRQNINSEALAHQAIAWAESLARKFHANLNYARHVRSLSMQLFLRTADLHNLGKRDALLLQVAALVHEIGMTIRPAGHHKHAYYLIKSSPMVGLSIEEKRLVAIVVRYQRKRIPGKNDSPFSELTAEQQEKALRLNILLRLAIAMNKERRGNVLLIHMEDSKGLSQLTLEGKGDLLFERWALRKQTRWFEAVFERKLEII